MLTVTLFPHTASLVYLDLKHSLFLWQFCLEGHMELNDLLSFCGLLIKGMATPAHPRMEDFMRLW